MLSDIVISTPQPTPKKAVKPQLMILFCLIGVLLISVYASLSVGPVSLSQTDVFAGLIGRADAATTVIVQDIRLPRMLLSVMVGAILAMAGVALQGYLRNPLAEASVLGVSNAAALGAVISLYFGLAAISSLVLPMMAIVAALIAFVVVLAFVRRSDNVLTLILAGIAISTLAGALISLALNLSPNPFAAMEISFWLLGSLEDRSLKHVMLAAPPIIIGACLLYWDRRALDALSLGEDGAKSLGFDMRHVRFRLIIGIALGVGGAVAVTGSIGFIGLIVPHMVSYVIGFQRSRLFVPAAIAGAALLTLADVAVRLIPSSNELRLGAVTALLGVPFFLHLIFKLRRNW